VKVVTLVLVTAGAGSYLGSMQSGISSVQRGLLDTLLGIGLGRRARRAERGSGTQDSARMRRTADRPMAAGRFSLTQGVAGGWARWGWAWWLLLHTNLLTVALALLTAFGYVAIYTPLKRVTRCTFIGGFRAPWAPCWLDAARGRSCGRRCAVRDSVCVQFPHFMPSQADIARTSRAGSACCRWCSPTAGQSVVEALSTPC